MKSNKLKSLPNLIVVGVPKSGTTFLYQLLKGHPDICVSKVKETRFFTPKKEKLALSEIEHYKSYFKHYANEKILMETSPGYFYGGIEVAQQIKETLGDIKIIVVLRNPVDRLFSAYKHKMRFNRNENNDSFLEFSKRPDIEKKQIYHEYLSDWFQVFNSNFKVIFFDDLVTDTHKIYPMILSWLRVGKFNLDENQLNNPNQSVMYKNKRIHQIAIHFFTMVRSYLPFSLRTVIRRIYFTINGKPLNYSLNQNDKLDVETHYAHHNSILKQMLVQMGYDSFPDWLND